MAANQTQEKQESAAATERAEELLGSVGRGFGVFVATTGQRVQRAATTVREKAGQRGQEVPTSAKKSGKAKASDAQASEAREASMERADELVRLMEFRLARFALSMNHTIQKTTARVREEAEDMWAEAQHIRYQNRQKPR